MQIRSRSSRLVTMRAPIALVVLVAALFAASPVAATTAATVVLRTGLPSHILTPGATNPAVTQATIHRTICVSGWTTTIRPPSSYTTALKVKQLATYGFADRRTADYEEDHLISLELGGNPRSAKNLWPEPHHVVVGGVDLGSFTKDAFENSLKRRVCAGTLSLASAQAEIAGNWVKYWRLSKTGSATPPPPTAAPAPVATPTPTPTPTPAPVANDPVAAAKAAGATAICRDNSLSFSSSRSGTCSRHGGVYWWTGNLGPAGPG